MSRFFEKIQNTLLCNGGIWGILNIGKNFPRKQRRVAKEGIIFNGAFLICNAAKGRQNQKPEFYPN